MQKPEKHRPGFVRVLVTERNKTIRIRESHARNPKYMIKHGLALIPEPVAPPQPIAPPLPPEIAPQPTATKPKSQPNGK